MGLYALINDQDRINMRLVKDLEIKQIFDEARNYDKSLMISETTFFESRGWFKKPKEVKHYSVYHECFNKTGHPTYEARQQLSASGTKQTVLAYLYGIINGYLATNQNTK